MSGLRNLKISETEIYAVIAFFIFFAGILFFTFYTPNYYTAKAPVEIEIKRGMTLGDVIDTLHDKNVIHYKLPFKVAVYLYNADNKIKAGNYEIPNGYTYFDLIEKFTEGKQQPQYLITIPEGIYTYELASIFGEKIGIDSSKIMSLSKDKKFIKSLDMDVASLTGYLLPNTYYFFKDATEEEILRKLVNEMDKLFDAKARRQMKKLGMTEHEILTLASIIDAETNISSEFATVSGVYHNRLERGIALQADPTIMYINRFENKNRVYYKDLKIDSPYNTYLYPGLPPGPINNPGKEAVMAALYPEDHDYLYFVADGTGGHKFARTHEEHLQNVREYRRWRRSQ